MINNAEKRTKTFALVSAMVKLTRDRMANFCGNFLIGATKNQVNRLLHIAMLWQAEAFSNIDPYKASK